MWDFPWYTSRERAFSFLRGASATMGARAGAGTGAETGAGARTEAGAGTRASRTVLRIRYKSSSEYLGILLAATGALATGGFVKSPAGSSDNSSPDSGGGEESGEVTEGAAEERLRQGRPRPQTEVILELVSFLKTLFQMGWLTR